MELNVVPRKKKACPKIISIDALPKLLGDTGILELATMPILNINYNCFIVCDTHTVIIYDIHTIILCDIHTTLVCDILL